MTADNPPVVSVADLERALRNRIQPPIEARTLLRQWMGARLNQQQPGSVAETVAELAKTKPNDRLAATIILRSLVAPDVFPDPSQSNQIARSIVTIAETALAPICEFIKVDRKSQTYERYSQIKEIHARVCELLEPFKHRSGAVESLVASQKTIFAAMNHSVVRCYCEPIQLSEIKSSIEFLFSKLKKIHPPESTFVSDFEDCRRALIDARATAEDNGSFLSLDYIVPFLENVESTLSQYYDSLSNKYNSSIIPNVDVNNTIYRKYPLYEIERRFKISLPFRNTGPGVALDVEAAIETDEDVLVAQTKSISMGNVLAGDFSVVLDVMVLQPAEKTDILVSVSWGAIGKSERATNDFVLTVASQDKTVDWQSLRYTSPYSTNVAEGDKFIGRSDKVSELAGKLLRIPMEPFYITGQKRTGKTSLAKAAAYYAASRDKNIDVHYTLWGDVAHPDPLQALAGLGQQLDNFVRHSLGQYNQPQAYTYDGSLAPLTQLFEWALRTLPERRFVIIIDEFDEIPQQLYMSGTVADAFFGNLRAISRRRNVCIVLVGGENMPFVMERQGQKLNNFARHNLSYFSRDGEWQDYSDMVRIPSEDILFWHDEAVQELHNISYGNPYYTQLLCAEVFKQAIRERDADITSVEVKVALSRELSQLGANSFVHLWQDGIPRPPDEREPDILRRSRVLVAIARCLRSRLPLTAQSIAERRASSSLSEREIPAVLNDFTRRDVLAENAGHYHIVLPIFEEWLKDSGVKQLASDKLSEEIADSVLQAENAAAVLSSEVADLTQTWPTYRGRRVGTDEVRKWYEQVESPIDQRILFKLLQRTRFLGDDQVRERLREIHGIVRRNLPVLVTTTRKAVRNDIIVVYVDGEAKSGATYASMYADENSIASRSVMSAENFGSRYNQHVEEHGRPNAIVIVDDIAATARSLIGNVSKMIEDHGDRIAGVTMFVVTVVATQEARIKIEKFCEGELSFDLRFHACETLGGSHVAFPIDVNVWANREEEERARALCIDIGSAIYKRTPLGYGDLGLLVVFPTTVPNNTLPLLHSHSKGTGRRWAPLFLRPVN